MRKSSHVLIVEDDRFLADVMQKTLRAHGVRVIIARDGKEALARIRKQKPALLLLDILMPEVDGFGVLEQLKSGKRAFPVIVLSNLSDPKSRKRCEELGVKCFYVKSDMDDAQLWPAVKKYIV